MTIFFGGCCAAAGDLDNHLVNLLKEHALCVLSMLNGEGEIEARSRSVLKMLVIAANCINWKHLTIHRHLKSDVAGCFWRRWDAFFERIAAWRPLFTKIPSKLLDLDL